MEVELLATTTTSLWSSTLFKEWFTIFIVIFSFLIVA
jgi:hypothetical protein